MTEASALAQLASLCSRAEHCSHELLEKLRRWQLPDDAQARIMERLQKERYFDDERYARAFVADKIKYNGWGRRKVEQALWQKHIDDDIRKRVLDEVGDEEYLAVLRPLLKQKHRSIASGGSPAQANSRLIRFAMSRGFDYRLIKQCLDIGANASDDYYEEDFPD